MSAYRSVHQPRRQQISGGKIKNPALYDMFYDITYEALQRRQFPTMTLPTGQLVVRKLDFISDKVLTVSTLATFRALSIEEARTIPPGSSMKLSNRFSGARLDGRNGQGALYVGTVAGALREHAHYANLNWASGSKLRETVPELYVPGGRDATAELMRKEKSGKVGPLNLRYYLFRVAHPMVFADLRPTSLAPLFQQLCSSHEAASRFGLHQQLNVDEMLRAPADNNDYSASRGIADAVFDRRHEGLAGVCAQSARGDSDSGLITQSHGDPTGGLNFAIFENDGVPVMALEPAAPRSRPEAAVYETFDAVIAAVG